ncbi:WhiB family transcriptional regulator [Nocardioides sp. AE5]|uniref:WhiB family transcriptional regulator n=1 Tax=Nocardioides sp. AE5 TaxID=2962573 RepID=UPI0028812166|nr:WhiB family transcriptional regulator [Nocardioides sp. AE5]MDT0200516.1 WhiB family transcriptional regulator [Nocardioides sp. AE5]
MFDQDWTAGAACSKAQADELFVRGAEQNKAKSICMSCAVRTECLAEALENQIEWGVWGGMTERERRALLRRKPGGSWRSVLESAKAEHKDGVAAIA